MKIYDSQTLKRKIKNRKTVGKIVYVCLGLLVAFVFVCAGIAFCQKVIGKRQAVNLFGYSSFAVISGSMQPSIDVLDIVVVKKVSASKLSAGDVIAFYDGDKNVVTHRIAEVSARDGTVFYTTKGDANNANDTEAVPYENVIGKYRFKISGGARIFAAIASPSGILLMIFVFASVGFLIIRKSNRKAARHSIREKYKRERGGK